MPISESWESSFPLALRYITMQSLTFKVSCHGICQPICITLCLSENNTLSSFRMLLKKNLTMKAMFIEKKNYKTFEMDTELKLKCQAGKQTNHKDKQSIRAWPLLLLVDQELLLSHAYLLQSNTRKFLLPTFDHFLQPKGEHKPQEISGAHRNMDYDGKTFIILSIHF